MRNRLLRGWGEAAMGNWQARLTREAEEKPGRATKKKLKRSWREAEEKPQILQRSLVLIWALLLAIERTEIVRFSSGPPLKWLRWSSTSPMIGRQRLADCFPFFLSCSLNPNDCMASGRQFIRKTEARSRPEMRTVHIANGTGQPVPTASCGRLSCVSNCVWFMNLTFLMIYRQISSIGSRNQFNALTSTGQFGLSSKAVSLSSGKPWKILIRPCKSCRKCSLKSFH